jgi:hypothetical protein
MVSLRCVYCGWAFNITGEEAAAAFDEAARERKKTYVIHCPNCRRANKVSVQQLRRGMARPAVEEEEPAGGAES